MRLLLVEDDPALAEGIAEFLRGQGDEVEVEGDGMRADRLLQNNGYDFVLLDVGLPGLGGYELVRRIRKRGQRHAGDRDHRARRARRPHLRARPRRRRLPGEALRARRAQCAHARGAAARGWRRGEAGLRGAGPRPRRPPRRARRRADELSGREWEVLEALVRADGRTVTRENLQGDGSGNALEVCISRLRPRVEPAGLLIRTVRGFGYRLERSKEQRDGADQPPA